MFEANHASELGGALYATSAHQTVFVFSYRCFVSQHSVDFIIEDKWLIFINNTALYGFSIYADSLIPCVRQVGGDVTNISASILDGVSNITPAIEDYTIATSPAIIEFYVPVQISPGERISLNITSRDDLKQRIPSAFKVTLDSVDGAVKTNPYVSDDGQIQIWGIPETEFRLTLQTQNTRHVAATKSGKLGECPVGFLLQNYVCICSASTNDRQYLGVPDCDMAQFRAFLHVGYWLGYASNGMTVTSICPSGYCKYKNGAIEYVILPRSSNTLYQNLLCIEHRIGQVCGQCEKGYTVYYHSDNFLCGRCPYGATGLVMYIFSELVPLAIFFAFIMFTKVKMTSGLMQSILLFSQAILFINSIPSLILLSPPSHSCIRAHTFLIGFLNLD